jgi:hypothetical protein
MHPRPRQRLSASHSSYSIPVLLHPASASPVDSLAGAALKYSPIASSVAFSIAGPGRVTSTQAGIRGMSPESVVSLGSTAGAGVTASAKRHRTSWRERIVAVRSSWGCYVPELERSLLAERGARFSRYLLSGIARPVVEAPYAFVSCAHHCQTS